jgi:hypothetical protein
VVASRLCIAAGRESRNSLTSLSGSDVFVSVTRREDMPIREQGQERFLFDFQIVQSGFVGDLLAF